MFDQLLLVQFEIWLFVSHLPIPVTFLFLALDSYWKIVKTQIQLFLFIITL